MDFFFEITKPFLSLDLRQNKFHKKLRKIMIDFCPKLTSEINVQKRHEKVYRYWKEAAQNSQFCKKKGLKWQACLQIN